MTLLIPPQVGVIAIDCEKSFSVDSGSTEDPGHDLRSLMRSTAQRVVEFEKQLAARDSIIAEQSKRLAMMASEIEGYKRLVGQLTEQLNRNSKNSHLPPSSDGPGARGGGTQDRAGADGEGPSKSAKDRDNKAANGKGSKSKDSKKKRKRGGQPNHRGNYRPLLPPDQVDKVVNVFPSKCDCCDECPPRHIDPDPVRFQVTEIPEIKPTVTEYRFHRSQCQCGNHVPPDLQKAPKTCFGPRLMSIVALLTGDFHLSRRRTVRALKDILGAAISLGSVSSIEKRVSDAIEPAVAESWSDALSAEVKHADATSWLERGAKRTLWVIATAMVTVFKVVADGTTARARPLFGACKGILVSDRATVFSFWKMKRRQICWAHLVRRFVAFSERDGPAAEIGDELLGYAQLLFEYWHELKAGRLDATQFRAWMAPVQENFEQCLQRAVDAAIDGVSGSCADILAHRDALWTFVSHSGVPPTNNHGEQELRGFVLWRKRSFGAQSDRGHRFAERIMTVTHTARKQKRNVLQFLYEACCAHTNGGKCPSLLHDGHAASC